MNFFSLRLRFPQAAAVALATGIRCISEYREHNKNLNPTPESIAALRGKFRGGAG